MTYRIYGIDIEDGVIVPDFFSETEHLSEFLSEFHFIEEFPVKGWNFDTILLTHGTQENGCGWAFGEKE